MTKFGKIEHMPIGAVLTGIYSSSLGDNPFDIANYDQSIRVAPKTIEVHDDTITLMCFFGKKRSSAEVNIKRGTIVMWEVK